MRTVTTTAIVGPDHTMTVTVPADIPPGPRQVVIILEEPSPSATKSQKIEFTPYPVGPSDPTCTYRREDLYGDDGR